MNIQIGKLYKNKSWKFLAPCLCAHGDVFVKKFNSILKLAVGIHDSLFDGSSEAYNYNLFILCDSAYQPYHFFSFLEWVRTQEYYITDYCPESNFQNSRKLMLVLKLPKKYYKSYVEFLSGNYTKMFTSDEMRFLFYKLEQEQEYNILTKNIEYGKKIFIPSLIKEFSTENHKIDLIEKDIEYFNEYSLPLKCKEEIFNYNDNLEFVNYQLEMYKLQQKTV